jgi:hypothetical protein
MSNAMNADEFGNVGSCHTKDIFSARPDKSGCVRRAMGSADCAAGAFAEKADTDGNITHNAGQRSLVGLSVPPVRERVSILILEGFYSVLTSVSSLSEVRKKRSVLCSSDHFPSPRIPSRN